jgi:3-oxo-5-alpha-steroid 4-dehydrogenase 1
MGTWLGGRTLYTTASTGAVPEVAMGRPLFWVGIALWALGFAGNLLSDEILYNLRKPCKDGKAKPRYSIPQGFLYTQPFGGISFPAYLCEWVEWLGFAMAACSYSPAPALPSLASIDPHQIMLEAASKLASVTGHPSQISNMLGRAGTYATPPFLFLFAEIASKQLHPV